jgi:hypothetical protein
MFSQCLWTNSIKSNRVGTAGNHLMHSLAKVYGSLLAKKLGPAGQKDQQERVGSEVPKTYS